MYVAHREDRSAASFLLYNLFMRPLARQLRKVKHTDEEGSPRLHPSRAVYRRCKIQERQVAGIWLYDIISRQPQQQTNDRVTSSSSAPAASNPARRNLRIYYFAGGSWQSPPDTAHFKFLAALAQRLSHPAIITLVSAPLAPRSPASRAFPMLSNLYNALMSEESFDDEDVWFAGDSSGGNIALALTMAAIDSPDHSARKAPHNLMLLSPTVNMVHDDPALEEASRRDPIESLEFIRATAAAWAGELELSDPRLSPALGTIKNLADYNVKVYGVIAGDDVLGVEALTFADKCTAEGVQGRFLVWDKQIHNFPLTAPYKVPEGLKALEWITHAFEQGGRNFQRDSTIKEFERIEKSDPMALKDWREQKADKIGHALKQEYSHYHPAP